MADSSTSSCFTHMKSDLSEFEVLDDKDLVIKTASKTNSLRITGIGAIILMHKVTHKSRRHSVTTHLYPVYYLPGLLNRLISVGHLLNSGFELRGSSSLLSVTAVARNSIWPLMQCKPHSPGQNLYWLSARLTSKHSLLALSLVHTIDYNIMHRHFAHPSKDVLQHASGNTQNFPSNMPFPTSDPVCPGCAEGKMTRLSFPPSLGHSKAPFDKIHMDLKEFSVQSYNKYKVFHLVLWWLHLSWLDHPAETQVRSRFSNQAIYCHG